MPNDDLLIIPKQGWLKVKLNSQVKWHRRYCIIDWDKCILFIALKIDGRYRDYIKLLPNILINEIEPLHDRIIEIKIDIDTHLIQIEQKREYNSWLLALKRTAYSRCGGAIFGQSLEDTYKYAFDKTSLVPLIVRHCCEHLLEYGSSFVGIFRIPGKQSSIKELRDMYDRGIVVELNHTHSPATISSLLKMYLQSLPEPILPVKDFDDFFEIGSRLKYNETKNIERLKKLIEKSLSKTNYSLLAYLCLFLKKLTEHVHETKMDTDNLALTIGNSLIRTAEELDLNMIKGHNYNLIPLIKAFINYSDYLFSTKTNESIEPTTKSNGFSSLSPLFSTNEPLNGIRLRSSSMPSIHSAQFSSINSTNLCYTDQYENNHHHSTSLEEKHDSNSSSPLDSPQSFTTYAEPDISTDQENNFKLLNSTTPMQSELSTLSMEEYEENIRPQSMISVQNHVLDVPSQTLSTNSISSSNRKLPKKTLVNKFGKSFSTFKSNMTKAFNPNVNSIEAFQNTNTLNISAPLVTHHHNKRDMSDSTFLNHCLKSLQNENRHLKELIEKKESLLFNLTQTSYEERLKHETESNQLKQTIKQLRLENSQLKTLTQSHI